LKQIVVQREVDTGQKHGPCQSKDQLVVAAPACQAVAVDTKTSRPYGAKGKYEALEPGNARRPHCSKDYESEQSIDGVKDLTCGRDARCELIRSRARAFRLKHLKTHYS